MMTDMGNIDELRKVVNEKVQEIKRIQLNYYKT